MRVVYHLCVDNEWVPGPVSRCPRCLQELRSHEAEIRQARSRAHARAGLRGALRRFRSG
jgi:hypothetical protein